MGKTPRLRRSDSGEANASGASNPGLLSANLANSIQSSNALHKTYAPVDVDAVLVFDKARLAGRQKRRGQNETETQLESSRLLPTGWTLSKELSA